MVCVIVCVHDYACILAVCACHVLAYVAYMCVWCVCAYVNNSMEDFNGSPRSATAPTVGAYEFSTPTNPGWQLLMECVFVHVCKHILAVYVRACRVVAYVCSYMFGVSECRHFVDIL